MRGVKEIEVVRCKVFRPRYEGADCLPLASLAIVTRRSISVMTGKGSMIGDSFNIH